MSRPSRRSGRVAREGTLRLLVVLVALVGVNVYFLGFRGGTSIGALLHTARVHDASQPSVGQPLLKAAPRAISLVEDPAGGRVTEGLIADGQTIAQALAPKVGKKLAAALEEALAARFELASVRAGQLCSLVYDADDRLVAFEFRASPMLAHRVDVVGRKLVGSTLEGKADTRIVDLVLPAGPGMWDALHRAGESPALAERLSTLFGGEGEIAGFGAMPGERVRVIVEKRMLGGRFVRYGRVLGAEWATRAGVRRAFYAGGSEPGYYTERGEAVARTYLASPIRASRAAGKMRRAERVIEATRVSYDHAAPPGALVCAVAAGTVTAISRGATGSTVSLEVHPGELVTYTRLTRLSRGLQIGGKLAQGQAIGRVDGGVTLTYEGAAAGLHDGRSLPPRLAALPAAERPRFGESIAPILERLRALALRPSDPLAARALSAIP